MDFPIIETEEVDWTGLAFTLYFKEALSQEQAENLVDLIRSWYHVGVHGGYGGKVHFMSDVGFGEDEDLPTMEWWVDMGSAEKTALDIVLRCIQGFSTVHQIPIEKLVLGFRFVP